MLNGEPMIVCEDCPADDSYWCEECSLEDAPNSRRKVKITYHYAGKADPILQLWVEEDDLATVHQRRVT